MPVDAHACPDKCTDSQPHQNGVQVYIPTMRGIGIWMLLSFSLAKLISSDMSPLNGKHVIVGTQVTLVHLYVVRNSSGYILEMDGTAADTFSALSRRFNFTYSVLQVNDSLIEKQSEDLPGLAYYIAKGRCDLIIGPVVSTPKRAAVMEFADGFMYTTGALLIPMPKPSDNVAAVAKPFQLSVWIALLFAMPITTVAIYFVIRPTYCAISTQPNTDHEYGERIPHILMSIGRVFFEIFRIILNQGSFVLVCSYSSLLTSYILGSNAEPLVDSLNDLAVNSNVKLVVDKGLAVDIVVSAAVDGLYKQLGDKMRSQSKSSCATFHECIELVKSGSYTYLNGLSVTLNAIDEDYKATGKCNLALARKPESVPGSLAWALPKKSPYTSSFTKGFMELHQAGLIDEWTQRELQKRRNVTYCLNEARKIQQHKITNNLTKITLKNFSGAFYVLIIGYILSLICFIGENVYFNLSKFYKSPTVGVKQEVEIVPDELNQV
uniref:Ionotropic glutamate receptor L-glutamate and glycine-binding domain-containing protein n=1 Tax=Daphnia galeata TaxID=27404 RepID=A0A8J2RW79_9CRUS|nr:unnamed protein product [Daphnia galeata]